MTSNPGEVVVLHPVAARADPGAIVPVRAEQIEPSSATDLSNVVPFARPRAIEPVHSAPDVVLPADLARLPEKASRDRLQLAGLVALSLAIHGGFAATLFWHEPSPLASIGLEVISVEITLGATAPAGAAPTQGENEAPSAAAPEPQSTETEQAEQKATAQPQTVEVAKEETAPEQKVEQPKQELKEAPQRYETASAPDEPAQPESKPSAAMVETPNPDTATDTPREAKPDTEISLLPQPAEKPAETKPDAQPKQAAPKPVKDAAPAKERRRIAAPTRETPVREAKASTPSSQANNVGIGRSSDDTNYRGLVSAHLARYKQPLPDTRGTASVTFTVGGSGSVTSVRLAHGSGVASIDSEVQAMVRRASPFPAPPGGRPQSFTVPVSFRVN